MMKYILFFLLSGLIYPFHTAIAQQPSKVLNDQSRNQVIRKMGNLLIDNYVETETALACNRFLIHKMEDGGYEEITHPRKFAEQLNTDLIQIHKDRHIRLQFIPPEGRDFELRNPKLFFLLRTQEKYKENMGIRELKILTGNVGYIDIRNFEPLDLVREKMINAMRLLEDVDALIIDLRKNNGGNPTAVQFLSSWFFDRDIHLNSIYWRRDDYTEEFWTMRDIGIDKKPELPLFILIGSKSFSAAEEFAYNMKNQKRATLIGAKTAGGANPGYTFSLSDQFNIFIPTGRSVNPITETNWEGVGVVPDILTKSSNAFNIAYEKAMLAGRIYREKQDDQIVIDYMKLRDDLNKADILFTANEIDSANAFIHQSLLSQISKRTISEWTINALGYQYKSDKNYNLALALFRFNADQYPESANAWDSLGEGYYNIGNWELGIRAYEKSLRLNPNNQNAEIMIKKIRKRSEKE